MRTDKITVRLFKSFLCVLLCLLLFGCARGGEAQVVPSDEATSVAQGDSLTHIESTLKADLSETEEKTDKTTVAKSDKQTTVSQKKKDKAAKKAKTSAGSNSVSVNNSRKNSEKSSSAKSKTTSVYENTTAQKDSSKHEEGSSSATTSKPKTTAGSTAQAEATTKKTKTTTSKTSSVISCTYQIECTQILDHMGDLKKGHERYVPSDGIILNTYSVSADSPVTVYDVLKTVCSDNGVKLNARKSPYGVYIAGFNNIDEKDCGTRSGWTYTVNGKYPPKSCDKYKLSNGDTVIFKYTCS